ncbi:MAG: heat-inducible transcriptional repressor HrcA [Candidatus Acidiferrales bacterium]
MNLDARKQEILALIVRTHIATGEPVSSGVIARRCATRLSSATIRNVMASLEEAGFLRQPHTSAGRTPTGKAYEFYAQEIAPRGRLSSADQKWINRNLAGGDTDAEALLSRAPHVLGELCHGVGLVLMPPLASTALEQVRFLTLDAQRLLAVVITRAGLVRDKVVRTRNRLRADELERMNNYLNENFRGWTLAAIRAEMERRVAAERSEFLRLTLDLCRETFQPQEDAAALRLEGVAHLTEQVEGIPADEWRELLQALEEKERLAQLLADCVESPEQPLRVVIGLERLSPAMKDFALIGARYGRGVRLSGSLGLLGRTRMDYDRAVTAVAYVAKFFDRVMTEN